MAAAAPQMGNNFVTPTAVGSGGVPVNVNGVKGRHRSVTRGGGPETAGHQVKTGNQLNKYNSSNGFMLYSNNMP